MNWISFKSRQPIDGQKVLIYTDDNEMYFVAFHDNKDYMWPVVLDEEDDIRGLPLNKITHWASPQPPEIE